MAASLKMFQICRSCLKCLQSNGRVPIRLQKAGQFRSLSTTKCLFKKTDNNSEQDNAIGSIVEEVDENLKSAAKELTDKLPGNKGKDVSSDLMKKLRSMNVRKIEGKGANTEHLGSVLNKMRTVQGEDRVIKEPSDRFKGPSTFQLEDRRKFERKPSRMPQRRLTPKQGSEIDFKLFEGPRLGIFEPEDMQNNAEQTKETLWDVYEREQLEELQAAAPRNGFEEMIVWTKQGKMWQFPIDNEQGWEEEQKTPFHEHIFLDHLIEDFPRQGPLRHFMELVIIGLSKNAGLTAQQKREHIQWFREYFIEKQDILKETLGENGMIGLDQHQIEAESV